MALQKIELTLVQRFSCRNYTPDHSPTPCTRSSTLAGVFESTITNYTVYSRRSCPRNFCILERFSTRRSSESFPTGSEHPSEIVDTITINIQTEIRSNSVIFASSVKQNRTPLEMTNYTAMYSSSSRSTRTFRFSSFDRVPFPILRRSLWCLLRHLRSSSTNLLDYTRSACWLWSPIELSKNKPLGR